MGRIVLNNDDCQSFEDTIINELTGLDGLWLHRHELFLITCYLDFVPLRRLIKNIKKLLKLSKVNLLFNFTDIYRNRRPDDASNELMKISQWCEKQEPQIAFDWKTVKPVSGVLMHAKAYAILQRHGKNDLAAGRLFVTSANLTNPGFGYVKAETKKSTNLELSYMSSTLSDIKSFVKLYGDLRENYSCDIDPAVLRQSAYNFKYALLSSGVFLHKWAISLSSQIAIRYFLTEIGKDKVIQINPIIQDLGFELGADSLTLQPLLNKLDIPQRRLLPNNFISSYTIDTILGRWCPNSVWDIVEDVIDTDNNFEKFRKGFIEQTEPAKLNEIVVEIRDIEKQLLENNYIHPDKDEDNDRAERWKEKITELRSNEDKLRRMFIDYESFQLPHDAGQRKDVLDLFESLWGTIDLKTAKNIVSKKVINSYHQHDIELLELNEDEESFLENRLEEFIQGISKNTH